MKDYARAEHGSSIVMTSCVDDRYPPENVLDGKDNTFWITTGMFPQEFVLALAKPIQVEKITFLSQSGKVMPMHAACLHAGHIAPLLAGLHGVLTACLPLHRMQLRS